MQKREWNGNVDNAQNGVGNVGNWLRSIAKKFNDKNGKNEGDDRKKRFGFYLGLTGEHRNDKESQTGNDSDLFLRLDFSGFKEVVKFSLTKQNNHEKQDGRGKFALND